MKNILQPFNKPKLDLLRELFDSIPDAVYFKDKKGRLIMVNKAHAAGLGLKPQEVVGKTDFDFFPLEQARQMTDDDNGVMRTGRPLLDALEKTTRPDGSRHYVSTTKLPRRDEKGRIAGIMGITRDITHRTQVQEDRYRILFETSQNCIFITTKDGRWVDINDAGVKLFGFDSKEEFLQTKVTDIYVDPQHREKYMQRIARDNFVANYEVTLKRKDGTPIYALITSVARRGDKNQIVGYQGTILDVTDRKKAEEENARLLLHLNARVKEISCLYRIDEIRQQQYPDSEATFKEVVSVIPSSWQYPHIAVARLSVKNTSYQTQNFKVTPWVQRADIIAHGKKAGTIEVCYLKKMPPASEGPFTTEERKLIDAVAQRLGMFIERRVMDEALQKTLKELADIKFALDTSSIVAITDREGQITYVNDKFCEISKYSREELLGKSHRILKSDLHPPEFFQDMWKVISSGKVWKGEVCNKAKDGSLHWLDTTIIPFLNNRGKPYQYIALRNEITERKQMEEAIKGLPQRIINAQESERTRISREIHDDLGQSLAILKMMIQSSMYVPDSDKIQLKEFHARIIKQLDLIIDKSRHLAAGLRPTALEILGLTAAMRAMVEDFKQRKDLKIEFCHDRLDHLVFKGEVINFYRIIQEALTNIITHAEASRVDIRMDRKKDRLWVTIKDNGKGFSVNKKENVQQGLGLSTMEERTNLLGGEFKIHSQLGKGTVVALSVPVSISRRHR